MTPRADKGESSRAPGLSRERILAAAQALVEAEGLDALSMRRLAQSLDVWPMALYRYFDDKDALLDALVARATDDVARPAREGSWRERIAALLGSARGALGGQALSRGERMPHALLTPGAVRLAQDGLEILGEAGFDADEAPRAWRALLAYTIGFAAQGDDDEAEFRYGLERMLDGLEAGLPGRAGPRPG